MHSSLRISGCSCHHHNYDLPSTRARQHLSARTPLLHELRVSARARQRSSLLCFSSSGLASRESSMDHGTAISNSSKGAMPYRGLTLDRGPAVSCDPMAKKLESGVHVPGQVLSLHSPEDLQQQLALHPGKLTVLMCKAMSCRPCKAFFRKYVSMAARFDDCVLMAINGDETMDTRKLMMQMEVKVTPTFRIYRNGALVHVCSGINEKKIGSAIVARMNAQEQACHPDDVAIMQQLQAEEEAAAASIASPPLALGSI